MPRGDPSRKRCAIYTRKSSEEGLEQEFNSLQAQCEACEAYIRSQRNEGWVLARTRYDDGGFSGGNVERPALQRMLADIQGGRIDIIVVYKVDRLTRSLADFARLVEVFDAPGGVVRVGDAAVQHDELDGAADPQCAVVLCPVRGTTVREQLATNAS
jgi:DNA invertase Pin-like site-specific DNA recombinase